MSRSSIYSYLSNEQYSLYQIIVQLFIWYTLYTHSRRQKFVSALVMVPLVHATKADDAFSSLFHIRHLIFIKYQVHLSKRWATNFIITQWCGMICSAHILNCNGANLYEYNGNFSSKFLTARWRILGANNDRFIPRSAAFCPWSSDFGS